MPKESQNRCQNQRFGDQRSDFWDFGECFWEYIFLQFLRHAKIDQKSKKGGPKSKKGGQGHPKSKVYGDLGSALRNARGRRGEEEGGESNIMRFDEEIWYFELLFDTPSPGRARGGGLGLHSAFRRVTLVAWKRYKTRLNRALRLLDASLTLLGAFWTPLGSFWTPWTPFGMPFGCHFH